MPKADRQTVLALRFLSKARTDLAVATVVLDQGPMMEGWVACFHAQQAAEKALKAVLVARSVEPPFVHNLVALRALLPGDIDLDASVESLADLSAYARGIRYVINDVDGSEDPTWDEAERAVVAAGRILHAVQSWLGADAK